MSNCVTALTMAHFRTVPAECTLTMAYLPVWTNDLGHSGVGRVSADSLSELN